MTAALDDYSLVFNSGSSSLKFSVFWRRPGRAWDVASRGQIDGIGTSPRLSAKDGDDKPIADDKLDAKVKDGRTALDVLAAWLRSQYGSSRALGVGHRVVHGGSLYPEPCVVTPQVIEGLRSLIPLAPLHQPHNIAAIEAVSELLPGVPQVACFDTSFHRGHAPVADLVPFPKKFRDAGVERYGFHGLSYEYIASVLPEVAPAVADGRVIVAHLGSGASMCALRERKSVDSTFGFTALDGLCMGTRPGSLDPGVVLHLFQAMGMSPAEVEKLLYEQSGLVGISGISNDMRDLVDNPDPAARLALDYFVYQAAKQIGALASVLQGIDAMVFTAGIGEHSADIRRRIGAACAWLGVEIDDAANAKHAACISTGKSSVSVWVIPTNEELMIARHMADLLGLHQSSA